MTTYNYTFESISDYENALESMDNVLHSQYLSNLMLEASPEERDILARRTNPVVLTVLDMDGRYIVTHEDGVLDDMQTEPLWTNTKDAIIEDCQRWYGSTCIINFITFNNGQYECWDGSKSQIITIVDTIQEAVEVLDTYTKTLSK